MSRKLAFLYFDLGNVLLRFDHEIACQQMAKVAAVSADRVREIVFESGLELQYERGELSTDEFYEEFQNRENDHIRGIEVKDDATLVLELAEPLPIFPSLLTIPHTAIVRETDRAQRSCRARARASCCRWRGRAPARSP